MDGAAARTRKGNDMGYTPTRTLYKLDFSETEHAGLEVTTRSLSIDGLLKIVGLAESVDSDAPDAALLGDLFQRFAAVLVAWNVEDDDGRPVNADYAGLTSQDPPFVMSVITAWVAAMSQAPRPLPAASPPAAPEESLQLASQSMPLPSLSAPG
jgi:hypothetical protein